MMLTFKKRIHVNVNNNVIMDIKSLILEKLKNADKVSMADILKDTGFSRAYINRFSRN